MRRGDERDQRLRLGRVVLELEPRVHPFGVLADDDQIDLVVSRRHTGVPAAGPHVREQIELLPKCQVGASQAALHRRFDRSLQRDP